MTRDQRAAFESRMNEMSLNSFLVETRSEGKGKTRDAKAREVKTGKTKDVKIWERLQASASPASDKSSQPILQRQMGDYAAEVGLSRSNILSASGSPESAARLLQARLLQELRPPIAHKMSPRRRAKRLDPVRQLLALQQQELAGTPSTHASGAQAQAGLQ